LAQQVHDRVEGGRERQFDTVLLPTEIVEMLTTASAAEDSNLALKDVAAVQELTADLSSARRQEFESVLPQVLPRFRRIAARWLDDHDAAEDAVQDAMVSAFTHITQFDGRAKMATWLGAIVVNELRMRMRRRRRGRLLSLDHFPQDGKQAISDLLADPRPTPEKVLERFELYGLALQLTRGLTPSLRRALRLHLQNDLSIRKLARKVGVPEGTLKAQLARGRARLAARFHELVTKPKNPASVPRCRRLKK
jgi:RNA polymerase sigma-70 factor (ECF subfamily)